MYSNNFVLSYSVNYNPGYKDKQDKNATSRRCDSEQNFGYKTKYSQMPRYPHIFKVKRRGEAVEMLQNGEPIPEANELPMSPPCDFYDNSESEKPRTQRYI